MAFLIGTDPGLRQTRTPSTDNFTHGVGFTANSSTTIVLSQDPGNENHLDINFDGIEQHRNTYTVSGTTVTFDAVIPTGVVNIQATYAVTVASLTVPDSSVSTAKIVDASVTTSKILDANVTTSKILDANVTTSKILDANITTSKLQDNAVSLAKMAHGLDGNLISFNAAGEPEYVATGSANQVLTSAGAGAPPVFADAAGGGAWTLISTQVASGDGDLTTTGLSTTYASYAVSISNLKPTDNRKAFYIRFGNSSGIVTNTSYRYHNETNNSGSGGYSGGNSASNSLFDIGPDIGNGSGEGLNGMFFIQPGNSSVFPSIIGNSVWSNDDNYAQGGTFIGQYNAALTMDRLQIRFSSGTIASGRLTVWGIAHA